ncbi:MAG: AI-2E family transporter, partial [Rhodospirillales bacterium]|nr:AI-2E family transporter [Rhodospirillales bacterium]
TGIAGEAGLILVYMLFLFVEQGSFDRKMKALFPDPEREERVHKILSQMTQEIQNYLWIKTFTSALTAGLSYAVLVSVGLDFAGFWVVIIFLLNYIPTIGSLLGILFPALLALVQFDTFVPFLIVTPSLAVIQVFIGNFLEPMMMGSSLNISPFATLVSLAVWGSIWGIPGMFLCVPITVIAMIIFAHFPRTRPIAIMLSTDGRVAWGESEPRPPPDPRPPPGA